MITPDGGTSVEWSGLKKMLIKLDVDTEAAERALSALSGAWDKEMTKDTHITLGRITSHGSGGRAEFILAHPDLTADFTSSTLTSKTFTMYPIGTYVTIEIILIDKKRRAIKNVGVFGSEAADEEYMLEQFIKQYGHRLDYLSKAAKAKPVKTPAPAKAKAVKNTAKPGRSSGEIYINPEDDAMLNTLRTISQTRHVSFLLMGGSGYGKTSIARQKAKDWGMNFYRFYGALISDIEEAFGYRVAENGSTINDDGTLKFMPSDFTQHVRAGNTVILVDEINRIDPAVAAFLLPLMDDDGKTNVLDQEIVVGPGTIFAATMNAGYTFTGTSTLDEANFNRFAGTVIVGPPPAEIEAGILVGRTGVSEKQAEKIVSILNSLRDLVRTKSFTGDPSVRVGLAIAEFVAHGLSINTAFHYALVNRTNDREKKSVLDLLPLE